MLSPSVWADQRSCQGDKLVINWLITIISPCPETLQFIDFMYQTLVNHLIYSFTSNNAAAGYKG